MNVGDLIEILEEFPRDMPVLLSVDAEGNHIKPMNGAGLEYAVDPTEWEVETACIEDIENDEYEKFVMGHYVPKTVDDFEKVIVVW